MSLPPPDPNTTVIVTGASAGIGTELARQLAERGYGLTLVARRKERLEELAGELRDRHGVDVVVHPADLSKDVARRRLIARFDAGPAVVGLANNAGFGTFGLFQDLPLEREVEEVALNVVALHELTGVAVRKMVARQSGAILNVGSVAGFQPQPTNSTYAATKAFVNSFSEAVHTDLAGTGVSCTVLCPGPVSTEFAEVAGVGELDGAGPSFLWASPADVAREAIEGMLKGKRTVVPGIGTKAIAAGGRLAPRTVLLPVLRRVAARQLSNRS